MPYSTQEKYNEWRRIDKLKYPQMYKIDHRISYLLRKLKYIENPEMWEHRLEVQRIWRSNQFKPSTVIYPSKLYIKESELLN